MSSATTSISGIYTILSLTKKNWVEFKAKTVTSLMVRGLSRHLDGTIKTPQPLPTSADGLITYLNDRITIASEMEIKTNLILLDNHAQKQALAIQQLYATVPNSVMIQVQNKGPVSEIWSTICDIY
ncbi:hypothetical protein BDN67DRAFT_915470, partial [Paxillus ammoniavirescens]